MIKFSRTVMDCPILNKEEKKEIIRVGDEYVNFKNNCSTNTKRKIIGESAPVLLGKSIYISSKTKRDHFWERIFLLRRNQIINSVDQYKTRLKKDIGK